MSCSDCCLINMDTLRREGHETEKTMYHPQANRQREQRTRLRQQISQASKPESTCTLPKFETAHLPSMEHDVRQTPPGTVPLWRVAEMAKYSILPNHIVPRTYPAIIPKVTDSRQSSKPMDSTESSHSCRYVESCLYMYKISLPAYGAAIQIVV